jgi:addiction module RelE/StbE family toxin
MAEIIWTPFALEDLQSIHDYIALDSPNYAIRYIDKLIDKTEILIDYPETGRIVPEFENEFIRELIEGNYRIIYKITSITEISIIRIHHSARLLK